MRSKRLPKLSVLVGLLLSQNVTAALLCEKVFATSDLSLFKGYFAIEKRIEKNLIMKHDELVSQRLLSPQDSLSQSGLPKPMGMQLEVQFPQDKGKFTDIIIYGQPYIENGQTFIDFKIWNRDWGSQNLIHDRESKILRRMTLEAFLEIGEPSIISYLKHRRKMVLIKTATNSFEIWSPKEFNDSMSTVIALSPRGEEKTFDYMDIVKWNLGLRSADAILFMQFFQLKGLGSIHVVPVQMHLTKIEPERTYLLVEKLPTVESKDSPLFSSDIKAELNQVLADNITLLMTGEGSGIHAAATRKVTGMSLKGPILIVTPTAHKYIIAHEMKHLNDLKQDIKNEIIAAFSSQFPTGKIGVSEITLGRFITLISEQRAYQSQFEAMKADSSGQIDSIMIETALGARELNFEDFMKKEYKEHQVFYNENYIDPIKEDFKKLREAKPNEWQFFFRIAKKYSLPSEDFSVMALFE